MSQEGEIFWEDTHVSPGSTPVQNPPGCRRQPGGFL